MSTKKRPVPEVDQVTPELEALLAQFTDEEIETGIMTRGPRVQPDQEHTPTSLRGLLADAMLQESLAQLLSCARATADYSLADMAERLGVTRSRAHQLECAGANLELKTLERCAQALGYEARVVFVPKNDDRPVLAAPVR